MGLGLGLGASLLTFAVLTLGVLGNLEGVVVDWLMRLAGPLPPDPRVAVVHLDAASIDSLGRWPWPRTRIAQLVDHLAADGARVVALDLVFAEPSRAEPGCDLAAEDAALAGALERAGTVVLSYFFRPSGPVAPAPALFATTAVDRVAGAAERFEVPAYPGVEANLDLFSEAARSQGFTTNERESGVARRYQLLARFDGAVYPALPLRAVQVFQGEPLSLTPDASNRPLLDLAGRGVGGVETVPTDAHGRLWVRYLGAPFATTSAAAVIAGHFPAGTFTGKLVFVGASELGIGDFVATPFGTEVPGVDVHATVADNLLSRRFVRDGTREAWFSLIALFLLGPLVALLVAAIERHLVGSLVAIGLILSWPVVAFLALTGGHWHLQVVAPVLTGVIALVSSLRYQVGVTDQRARLIRRTFERYVSQAVVEQMLRDPERVRLGGERREMTVLFSDIRGFTTLSEKLDSEALVALLNEFFTAMTRLILAQGGTLDKYMGDAIMAFFGAPVDQPDHAARACRAVLAMRDELVRLNAAWRQRGLFGEDFALGIGIGLNSGPMAVGNIGSEQVFGYTVIGDNVNLGSRIEGLNKPYHAEILVTTATARAAGAEHFLFRHLDEVRVKGKTEAVGLHELLAARPAPPALEDRATRFAAARALYLERRFAEAASAFEGIPNDGPAQVLAERCRAYLETPPPDDWDGVETLTSK